MRMSQEAKERSRERIVASAAKLMRERGIEGASVNDVMQAADMTHGGFYKHFDSKDALLAAALDRAFADIVTMLKPEDAAGETTSVPASFQAFYLSEEHLASPGLGCPIATLSGDIARSGVDLKMLFGAGVRRVTSLLARGLPGSERTRRARATRQLAMLAGALMIARASDAETAQEVLAACRQGRLD